MAQNKLENQIKEKLDSREIQPSAQAWDRLDAMLTVAEEKKTKRSPFLSFQFIGIAASVVVFITLGMLYFNQNSVEVKPENTVVGTEEIKKDIQSEGINQPNVNSVNDNSIITDAEPSNINHQQPSHKSVIAQQDKSFNQSNQNQTNNQQSIAQGQSPNGRSNQNPLIIRDKEIEFQNSSDVAQRNNPKIFSSDKPIVVYPRTKSQENVPTDEQLLAGLDNAAKKSTDKKASVKVDPKSLLSQVDGELEMTFREKVINKIHKNYQEVKVALAKRNNE